MLPVEDVLSRLNWFLVGWRGYFRWGNSSGVFDGLDRFVTDRVARFISNKHGRRGRGYGLAVLINDPRIRVERLVGTVKGSVIVHAVR